jgi:hypothetical protein
MSRRELRVLLVALALAVGGTACGSREGEEDAGDRDTLAIEAPAEVEDRFEEGARKIGGRVGEALGRTGEAIEEARERMEEETAEPAAGDTNRM